MVNDPDGSTMYHPILQGTQEKKTATPGSCLFPRQKTLADLRLWATSVSARRLALERLDVSGVMFGDVEDAPHW